MDPKINKKNLETIYEKYNKRALVNPDPLIFLYNYSDIKDREITALISASLAYGRVKQILKSVEIVLNTLGKNPHKHLTTISENSIKKSLKDFKHRFTTDKEIIGLLLGIKRIILEHGSLQDLFYKNTNKNDENILNALSGFVSEIKNAGELKKNSLLSDPQMGSACKRLNLFLRWILNFSDLNN